MGLAALTTKYKGTSRSFLLMISQVKYDMSSYIVPPPPHAGKSSGGGRRSLADKDLLAPAGFASPPPGGPFWRLADEDRYLSGAGAPCEAELTPWPGSQATVNNERQAQGQLGENTNRGFRGAPVRHGRLPDRRVGRIGLETRPCPAAPELGSLGLAKAPPMLSGPTGG